MLIGNRANNLLHPPRDETSCRFLKFYFINFLILFSPADSRKITDSGNPHSQASVQRVESEPRVERSVDGQMSSREDSSDSECEPAAESSDQCIGEKVDGAELSTSLNSLASAKIVPCKSVAQKNTKTCNRDLLNVKQGKRQVGVT